MANPLRQELIDLAHALAVASPEVLRVAHNEEDHTTSVALDAAHFLKLDGVRIGRDLELYGFMGDVAGWPSVLAYFLEEVVFALQSKAPEAYAVACEKLKEMGKKVFPLEMQPEWDALLAN